MKWGFPYFKRAGKQGRNEVYFFIADLVFLRKFLIPDPTKFC